MKEFDWHVHIALPIKNIVQKARGGGGGSKPILRENGNKKDIENHKRPLKTVFVHKGPVVTFSFSSAASSSSSSSSSSSKSALAMVSRSSLGTADWLSSSLLSSSSSLSAKCARCVFLRFCKKKKTHKSVNKPKRERERVREGGGGGGERRSMRV